jgi:16S rRNA processing protein RimM
MNNERLIVGQINGIFGVKGWVKIFSHTDPRDNIFNYSPWQIHVKGEWKEVKVEEFQKHAGGKALVAKLENIHDRDVAREFMGCEISILRSQLSQDDDEYFWIDLIGCEVTNQDGIVLGEVTDLVETGAHDVLRVKGEYGDLIPFVMDEFIVSIDKNTKKIRVNWEIADELEV